MTISVCVGTSCHIKGAPEVVLRLQELVHENQLGEDVTLTGTMCTGDCTNGVCVYVDGALHALSPEDVDAFFEKEVKAVLGK